MKKLALTNLIIVLAIRSVSACSYVAGYDPSEHITFAQQNNDIFFYGSLLFVFIIGVLYFFRKRKSAIILIVAVFSFLISIPAFMITALVDRCENSAYNIFLFEFSFVGLLCLIQAILLIKEFRQIKNSIR